MAKILISAYACEPNKGSEPEVGWQWVINIAKTHEVWILTKENNKETIEKYRRLHPNDISWFNMHFVFVHLPKWLVFWKKRNRGMRLYYYLWSRKAYSISKSLHKQIEFDLVHSITFVSLTQPCFLYKLGIPFVWTIAGGENISKKINYKMSLLEKSYETIRKIGQVISRLSIRTNIAIKKASLLLAATEETAKLIPTQYQEKVIVTSAIGIEKKRLIRTMNNSDNINVLLSGKFIYLKGLRIGIDAILRIIDSYDNVHFTILGNGPYEREYKDKCRQYINKKITFIDSIPHEEMFDFYCQYDFLINTALRDSGCLVAMEAMSVGLPIVCLNTGGVKAMTLNEFAIKIDPKEYSLLVEDFSNAISYMINNYEKRVQMGKKAYEYINKEYLYESKCKWLLQQYDMILKVE